MKLSKRGNNEGIIPLIILCIFALIALGPFIWAFLSSFKNTVELFAGNAFFPKVWRWQNYTDAWQKAELGSYFLNSVYITLFVILVQIFVSTFAGFAFSKLKLKNHPYIFYTYLIGMAVPVQATILTIFLQLKDFGLHNTKWGLILALVAADIPFATFLMRNFFKDISDSFAESAEIDGASILDIFFKIYLPLARPALMALTVFAFLSGWNEFNLSLVVLTDDKLWTIPLAVTSLRSHFSTNYGQIFAATFISCVPSILIYILFQRSFIEGISVGGEKG